MSDQLTHYGVKGMRWKNQKIDPKDKFKWRNTSGKNSVSTNNRSELVKLLTEAKKKAHFSTRDMSKLSNDMIRQILNSDQLKTKMSMMSRKTIDDGKAHLRKIPPTVFKKRLKRGD